MNVRSYTIMHDNGFAPDAVLLVASAGLLLLGLVMLTSASLSIGESELGQPFFYHTGRGFRLLPWLLLTALFAGATVALYLAGSWAQLVPVRLADQTGLAPVPPRVPPAPLSVPSVPQLALERAKALVADDRHAEALGVLATVGLGDGLRGEVDTLRAAIQQEMLSRLPEMAAGAGAESFDRPAAAGASR